MPGRPILLVLFLTASLAAFGGIYEWAQLPILVAAIGLALLSRAFTSAPSDTRTLDVALIVLLVAIAMQLLPLPLALRSALSPELARMTAALQIDASLQPAPFAPLSVNPDGTLPALMLAVAVVLTYRAARAIFSIGGVRTVCRSLSVVGAVFAVAAVVQRLLSPLLIYGFWPPRDLGAQPFGPVVNRNHFAGWLVMTATLTAGYFAMRVSRRMHTTRRWRHAKRMLVAVAQSTVVWTALSWVVMTATVLAAQSRSAIVALAVALVTLLRSLTHSLAPVVVVVSAAFVVGSALLIAGETTTTPTHRC